MFCDGVFRDGMFWDVRRAIPTLPRLRWVAQVMALASQNKQTPPQMGMIWPVT